MIDWESFYRRLREPDFVPGYEVLQRLGGGAFGDVYKARKRSIGKTYAIKFLKVADAPDPALVERELEQARVVAELDHPNLVATEDVGNALGVPFLVMGYAGEDTLARRLARGSLTSAEAFGYFVQTCRGVCALHARQLAHFDLKPSNVFLKGDQARVGDYGLAKVIQDGRSTLSFGRGTPLYMAPEMMTGRGDLRSDIYSLGALLFECLVGRPPFAGEQALARLASGEDGAPAFPEGFPAPLAEVVGACLERAPERRPPSVAELLGRLGQEPRPGAPIPLPWDPRSQRWAWEGPVSEEPASGAQARAPASTEVLEWEPLDDSRGRRPGAGPGAGRGAPPDAAVDRGSAADALPKVFGPNGSALSGGPADGPAAKGARATPAGVAGRGRGSGVGTVPVPPRHPGGPLSAAFALVRLALELALTVVRVPLGFGLRLGYGLARGFVGLLVFLVAMLALGALGATLVVVWRLL